MYSSLLTIIPSSCRVEYKNQVHVVEARDADTGRVYLHSYGWVPACYVTRTKRHVTELADIHAWIRRAINNHTTQTTETTITHDPLTEWVFNSQE